jgi:hypothetical protein
MNSDDPLFKNYMALYLSIVSNSSVTKSLQVIGLLGQSKVKKMGKIKSMRKVITSKRGWF